MKIGISGHFDIFTGDVEHLAGRRPRPLRDVLAAAVPTDGWSR
jgi:hypothetical protein